MPSGGGSRHASGRDETIGVPHKNSKVPAWIPPSAIKRDALLRPNFFNANNVIHAVAQIPTNYHQRHQQPQQANAQHQRHFNKNYTTTTTTTSTSTTNSNYRNQSTRLNPSQQQQVSQDELTHENEEIFRKCRGLLNRLTPEKFEKLAHEFCHLSIKSPKVLKAIIVFIFEKALNEPAYSALYAQLCQRLDKHVPNFDYIANSNQPNGPTFTTFRKLLLTVCQHEFDNRASYLQASDLPIKDDHNDERQTYAEYCKQIGKKKMLGNIKFIGELGQLDLLSEAILHKCIKTLLEKGKQEKYADMSDDLECLCKIMPTIGKKLDQNEARKLMDQYFERMLKLKSIQGKDALPQRIKFLIQDCIDLRANNWEQRKIVAEAAPQKVTDLRHLTQPEPSLTPPPPPPLNPFLNKMYEQFNQPNMTLLNAINNFKKLNHVIIQSPYTSFSYQDDTDEVSSCTSTSSSQTDLNKKDEVKSNFVCLNGAKQPSQRLIQAEKTRSNSSSSISALSCASSAPSPPPNDNKLNLTNLSQLLTQMSQNSELCAQKDVERYCDEYLKTLDIDLDYLKKFSNEKLHEFVYMLISHSLSNRSDAERLSLSKLFAYMQVNLGQSDLFVSSLRLVLDSLAKLEQEHHCVKSNVSIYIGRAVIDGLVDLAQLAGLMKNGAHYPLFFLLLQQMLRLREAALDEGKTWLRSLIEQARIDLLYMLPDDENRSLERLRQVLEDRELEFVRPMLKYESLLYERICVDKLNSSDLKKWIDENLCSSVIETNDFINSLITCILKVVFENKTQLNKQKEQIDKYQDILHGYLRSNREKQLEVLYAIQTYANTNSVSPICLTNLFNQMYELKLIDQETFHIFKI